MPRLWDTSPPPEKKKKEKKVMARKKKLPVVRKVKLETFIKRLGDQIFTVDFTKQNGDERTMNCRRKVRSKTKQVKAGVVKKRRASYGVHTPSILIYDMQKQAYRNINLETVTSIRAAGKTFRVV
jgi:hypothetical protein